MMRTVPVALIIENVAEPDCLVETLWLRSNLLGLIADAHCGIGDGEAPGLPEGDGDDTGVGDGEELGPFPLLPLSPPLPLPCGVAVGEGEASGEGLAPSEGDGLFSGLGDA